MDPVLSRNAFLSAQPGIDVGALNDLPITWDNRTLYAPKLIGNWDRMWFEFSCGHPSVGSCQSKGNIDEWMCRYFRRLYDPYSTA